jgi:hypothetical protein
MEFGQYVFHFTPREDYLSYFRSSVGGLPEALLYAVPYCEGFPLGPVAVVCGALAGNVFPLEMLSSLYFLFSGLVPCPIQKSVKSRSYTHDNMQRNWFAVSTVMIHPKGCRVSKEAHTLGSSKSVMDE